MNTIKQINIPELALEADDSDKTLMTLNLLNWKLDGYFSLQYTITGTGKVSCEVHVSNDGTNWVSLTTELFTDKAAGTYFISLNSKVTPPLCAFMRLVVTETFSNAATISGMMAVQ